MADAGSLLEAMLAVQAEAPTLKKDATNPHFKSKYAPLDTIVETINPLLVKNGLVWSTMPSFDDTTGEPTLRYELAHAPSGQAKDGEMKLLLAKGDPQGQGSAITYARRYALVSVLNLVADDDDDGHAASQGRSGSYGSRSSRPASDKQIALVRRLFTQNGATAADAARMLATAGVTVGEGESPRDACARLEFPGVSNLIEFLKDGKPVPTGESDATTPGDAAAFTHPPATGDGTLGGEPS